MDSTESLKWLKIAANNNDSNAQVFLAGHYYFGKWVKSNIDSSVYWYAKSLKSGSYEALLNLGSIYRNGFGEKKNIDTALNLYEDWIDLNKKNKKFGAENEEILGIIGDIYFEKKDYKKSLANFFLIKYRSDKLSYANYRIGDIYSILKNYNKAFYYLKKSDLPEARMKLKELTNR